MSQFVGAPKEAIQAVTVGLQSLLATSPQRDIQAMKSQRELRIAAGHKAFVVELSAIAEGQLLSRAQFLGWRFLMLDEKGQVLATAQATAGPQSEYSFGGLSRGPDGEGTVNAVRIVEQKAQATSAPVNFVAIPALYVSLLWEQGADNSLVAVAPIPSFLNPDRVYSEDELIKILRPRAIARLESADHDLRTNR